MNNMDIRCGEIQSINLNINYWIYMWTEYNDFKEIKFKNLNYYKSFHKELNLSMVNAYEKRYGWEDKYNVMDNLIQEYYNNKFLKII
jgi:hypothetical protein